MADLEEKKSEEQKAESAGRISGNNIPVKGILISLLILVFLSGGYLILKSGVLSGQRNTAIALDDPDPRPDIGPIYPMETFIVNLVGNQGKSYLKVKIELELNNDELKKEIDKRLPQFRDKVLTILSGKSNDEIKSLEGKSQLREEIIAMLNQFLKTGRIVNIYFTDFIVQ